MTFIPLNILITHECSGAVCREFRALGHSAFSCDLVPRTDGNTKHHILGDATAAMRHGRPTDGAQWDLVITHHVCRYLANSGSLRLYIGGKKANGADMDRWRKMAEGANDFRRQFLIGEYRGPLCAENPIMHRHARELIDIEGIAEVDGRPLNIQTIQPYYFGDDASKATQLWLRDLPVLVIPPRSEWCPPRMVIAGKPRWSNRRTCRQSRCYLSRNCQGHGASVVGISFIKTLTCPVTGPTPSEEREAPVKGQSRRSPISRPYERSPNPSSPLPAHPGRCRILGNARHGFPSPAVVQTPHRLCACFNPRLDSHAALNPSRPRLSRLDLLTAQPGQAKQPIKMYLLKNTSRATVRYVMVIRTARSFAKSSPA